MQLRAEQPSSAEFSFHLTAGLTNSALSAVDFEPATDSESNDTSKRLPSAALGDASSGFVLLEVNRAANRKDFVRSSECFWFRELELRALDCHCASQHCAHPLAMPNCRESPWFESER